MGHNLIPIVRKKPDQLIINPGTNDAKNIHFKGDFGSIAEFKKIG